MELFDMTECKSPRLKWMERHGIRTYRNEYMSRPWMAIWKDPADLMPEVYERGESEEDALVSLAVKLGIRTWVEEGRA